MKKVFNKTITFLCFSLIVFMGCSSPSGNNSSDPENNPGPGKTVEKIEITELPSKTEYAAEESLLTEGITVIATYSDGSKLDVTKDVEISGFDANEVRLNQPVTVTYNGKSTSFEVSVLSDINWYEEPEALEDGTDGTYGTEGKYVYFGIWPQKIVTLEKAAELKLDDSSVAKKTITRGYLTYVQGTDGNFYVKSLEKKEDWIEGSFKYSDNSEIHVYDESNPTYRWFKAMPIKWRVADENFKDATETDKGKLLIAENELTGNLEYSRHLGNDTSCKKINVYDSNYEYSDIRAYLNGYSYLNYKEENQFDIDINEWKEKGFVQTAFGEDAIKKIETIEVDNSRKTIAEINSSNVVIADDIICNNTNDKVFLLSSCELLKYSKNTTDPETPDSSKIRLPTDYAKANDAVQYQGEETGWWLRSPCKVTSIPDPPEQYRVIFYVLGEGYINCIPTGYRNIGIVPALVIKD